MVRTAIFSSHIRPHNLMVALAALLLGACEERCTELTEDEAAQYAKKYALSRTLKDYEKGNKWERRFVADLRKAGISEEDYRRIVMKSVSKKRDNSCGHPLVYYYTNRHEIAAPGYSVIFEELRPAAERSRYYSTAFSIRMTFCGKVYDYFVPSGRGPFPTELAIQPCPAQP